MVDRYMSLQFGANPLDGFRENDVYGQMGGQTTGAHVMTVALLCSSTIRAKNDNRHSIKMITQVH